MVYQDVPLKFYLRRDPMIAFEKAYIQFKQRFTWLWTLETTLWPYIGVRYVLLVQLDSIRLEYHLKRELIP